jgi:phosphoribosylanthranilate isomerase
MHIKICGLTTLADAEAALDAGADYLGFNFYPKSPRYLAPEACAQIVAGLGARLAGVKTVGIFVNEMPEQVRVVLATGRLDLAQLHGEESPETVQALGGRAYKAFRGSGRAWEAYAAAGPGAPAFLVDAYVPQAYGGTGQVADWAAAKPLAVQYPLFLAGGLTPENVALAVAQVRPWGVDVASGVESAPGKKDVQKMKDFVAAALAA